MTMIKSSVDGDLHLAALVATATWIAGSAAA